jgi:hypothetical protein
MSESYIKLQQWCQMEIAIYDCPKYVYSQKHIGKDEEMFM